MILCNIDDSRRYTVLSKALAEAIEWILKNRNTPFEKGVKHVGCSDSGAEIVAKYEETSLLPREKVSLEAHRRFIDIQLPVKGPEKMGWAPTAGLKLPRGEYDTANDILFFGDSATALFTVNPGQMVIFFPEDAHAPNIGLGNHRKIVVKVPVD